MMILFSVPNTYPGGKFLTLPTCFLLSEIKNYSRISLLLKRTKLWIPIVIMIVATIVLFLHSPHYFSLLGFANLFYKELICKYLYVVYAFICITSSKSLRPLLEVSYYSILLMTFLGVLNLITRHADFLDIAMQGGNWNDILEDMGGKYEFQERFRVQATFFNAFCYGYICVMNLLLFMYAYAKKMVSRNRFYIVAFCSIFGIIFCGCRTIIIVAIAAYFIYLMLAENITRKLKYFIVLFFVASLSYEFVKPAEDMIDKTVTIFDKKKTISGGGSSIESRQIQYARVFYYIKNNLLLGRGRGFFKEDLGYKDGRAGMVDKDLHGLEGVFLSILLERGVLGAVFYIIFLVYIWGIIWNYRREDRVTTAFSVTTLVAYFIFANFTGELASFPPTFLLIGMSLGLLYHEKIIKNVRINGR